MVAAGPTAETGDMSAVGHPMTEACDELRTGTQHDHRRS